MNDMPSQVWQGKPKLVYMRIRAPSLSICLIRNMGKTNESEVGKQKYLPADRYIGTQGTSERGRTRVPFSSYSLQGLPCSKSRQSPQFPVIN